MKTATRNMLNGMGSIFDITPSRRTNDFSRFVPQETDEERMLAIWQQAGGDLRKAMELYSCEQKKAKKIHP